MMCCICEKEIKNEEDLVTLKVKGFKGLIDGVYSICKRCVEEEVLKRHGFTDFKDYLKRYWGFKVR